MSWLLAFSKGVLVPKRTVKIGLATYIDSQKLSTFALEGAEVDVHPDDLERFDKYNDPDVIAKIGTKDAEPVEVLAVAEPLPAPDNSIAKPAGNASIEEWQEYAESQGADTEGKSRNELRELFT